MPTSYVKYTGDGSTTDYALNFTYISSTHVSATVAGSNATFTFLSTSQIRLASAPASGALIVIKRTTPVTALVDFADGSTLFEADLDLSAQQNRFIAEEATDTANDAMILDGADNKFDADSKVIKDVANPTADQDAVTKHYLENTWLSTTDKANLTAIAPKVTQIGLLGTADAVADMNTLGTADVVADMNTLGTADVVSDMNTLANSDIISDLNTLATTDIVNDMNILATTQNVSNMNTLAGISSNITNVAGKSAEITLLGTADAVADMNTLGTADVVADMNTLGTADVVSDMNTLGTADVVSDMNTLATSGNVTAMDTVATNIASVNTNATNISAIQGASTQATNAANSATASANSATASANSATASASSATSAASSLTTFQGLFTSASSAPSSPDNGDLWYDTANSQLKVYVTNAWQIAGAYLQGLIASHTFTCTANQTAFTTDDASGTMSIAAESNVFVYLNGIKLIGGGTDYSISGNTITLTSGAIVSDVLYVDVLTKISTTQETSLNALVTQATTAKNDAVTAKTGSETAETGAVAAKNAAEGFRDTASTHATTASTQASLATTNGAAQVALATTQANNSATSATSSASSLTSFNGIYRGSSGTAPSSPATGQLWYDSTNTVMKVYSGSAWVAAYVSGSGFLATTGGSLTGALATNSTIDGRDVATDGTKLDGIEASADVTDTANVTSAGALMLTGGTMSGALTVQESVTFESSGSSKPVLTLKNTNADTTPPSLTFQKDSSSPAINDEIANINFYGDDDGGNVTAYANLKVISPDPSNGSEDGMMTIKTMAGGTLTDTLVLASGNATVSTINATTVDLGNWTISELGGVLYFKTSGTNKMKLDASGNLAVAGDVTAFHTF